MGRGYRKWVGSHSIDLGNSSVEIHCGKSAASNCRVVTPLMCRTALKRSFSIVKSEGLSPCFRAKPKAAGVHWPCASWAILAGGPAPPFFLLRGMGAQPRNTPAPPPGGAQGFLKKKEKA